jgi:hypothetical protein
MSAHHHMISVFLLLYCLRAKGRLAVAVQRDYDDVFLYSY